MARGIYSALGRWPEGELAARLAALEAICAAIERDAPADELAAVVPAAAIGALMDAVAAIRTFERRVGQVCGLGAESVATPKGRAIEVGNRGHLGFGSKHEAAAEIVARALHALLEALGSTGGFWFTID